MNTKPPSDQDLDPAFDDVFDDTDLGEDTWDDAQGDDPKPRKKKGGLFNVIVIVVGIAAFVGIMYMRVAGTPVPQHQAAPQQTDASAQQTAEQTVLTQPTPDASAAPASTDPLTPMPDFAAAPDATGTTATSDATAAVSTDTTTVPDLDPTLATNVPDGTATPALTPPPEVAMTPNDAAPVAAAPVVPAEQPTIPAIPVPAATATPAPATSEVTATPIDQERLQAIEDRLNTLAIQMGEQKSTPAPSSAPSKAALADVQVKLDALMARLDLLEAKMTAAPKTEPVATPAAEPAPMDSSSTPSVDLGDAEDQTTLSEPVAEQALEPAPTVEVPVKTSRPKYVLRAVSRDKAYIASSKSAAVQGVAVGDTVPGWGTVRSITQGAGGRWSVVTDNGTIRQ